MLLLITLDVGFGSDSAITMGNPRRSVFLQKRKSGPKGYRLPVSRFGDLLPRIDILGAKAKAVEREMKATQAFP
jgi:hypothetical protein